MRKILVLAAFAILAFAGVLIAAPKPTSTGYRVNVSFVYPH
jgi:hypothetical protein